MRRPIFASLLALVLLAAGLAAAAQPLPPDRPPFDPAEGEIDGSTAMIVWPTVPTASGSAGYLPSAEGLTAVLVPRDDPRAEPIVHPAGEWFLPPAGHYRVWIEGDGWTNRGPLRMSFPSPPFRGRGVPVPVEVTIAGKVTTTTPLAIRGRRLHLLHAGPCEGGGTGCYETWRRQDVTALADGLHFPPGPTLAALWDDAEERYVALSRPFTLRPEQTVPAPLAEPPQDRAHLVLRLLRRDGESAADGGEIELRVAQGERQRPPDVQVRTRYHDHAVWYDLAPGEATLTALSPEATLVPPPLSLQAGRIADLDLQMVPRHRLEVELALPEPLVDEELTLVVRGRPDGALLARETLPPQTFRHVFPGMPPVVAEVELATPLGSLSRTVDLREEADAYLLLEPDFITLWGNVLVDGEGHPAELTLTTADRRVVKVETDDAGEYEVALVAPLRAAQVDFLASPLADHFDVYWQPIDTSRQLDFDLPGIRNRIEVVDAASGEPIPQAQVSVSNHFEEYDERTGRSLEQAKHATAEADEDGIVAWSAFRQGTVELRAAADGYRPMAQPREETVLDPEQRREFRLALEPLGETVEVTLLRPDGRPAAGAEVLLVGDLAAYDVQYFAESGADGRVALPRRPSGVLLLARHPETAFVVLPWVPAAGEPTATVVLPAAAPPLTVEVQTPGGDAPQRRARLVAWIAGRRFSGAALVFATGARPSPDGNGFWVAAGLPAGPVALLAADLSAFEEADAGRLDTLATEIPYPWPNPVVLRAVR